MVKQIIKEFWIPCILALLWTIYNITSANEHWALSKIINVFGPSFFLVSWGTGQFFRIKKQSRVDSNLTNIEHRVEQLIDRLEKHTKDFFGYTTGADSIAYFTPMLPSMNVLELGLTNRSSYPVFDIQAECIDLNEKIDPGKGIWWTRHRFSLESIYPNKLMMGIYKFDMSKTDSLKINIFIQTRTSGVIQEIRAHKIDGQILIALRTRSGDKIIENNVPPEFPGYDPQNMDAVFS
nr:hypothetical protein [uncultured Tolumonas sp.]